MSRLFLLTSFFFLSVVWALNVVPAHAQAPAERAEAISLRTATEERLRELVAQMGEEARQIDATRRRADRARLLAAHRQTMQEGMRLMREMGTADLAAFWEHMEMPSEPEQGASQAARSGWPVRRMPTPARSSLSLEQRVIALETRTDMLQIMLELMASTSAE